MTLEFTSARQWFESIAGVSVPLQLAAIRREQQWLVSVGNTQLVHQTLQGHCPLHSGDGKAQPGRDARLGFAGASALDDLYAVSFTLGRVKQVQC
jgi:hypothetical protein